MELVNLFAIFISIYAVLLLSAEGREMIFDDIRRNKLVNSNMVIKTVPAKVLIKCQQHCFYNEDCLSVHYNEKLEECKLSKFSMYGSRCAEVIDMQKIAGWNYYGTKQGNVNGSYEVITDKAYCSPNEHLLVRDNLLTTIPTLYTQWELSLKIRPIRNTPGDTIIFNSAVQPSSVNYKVWSPAIFFQPQSTKLYVKFSLNETPSYGEMIVSPPLPIGVYSSVVVMQYFDEMDQKYYVNVIINGQLRLQRVNNNVENTDDAQLFCADDVHATASAHIKDVLFRTW